MIRKHLAHEDAHVVRRNETNRRRNERVIGSKASVLYFFAPEESLKKFHLPRRNRDRKVTKVGCDDGGAKRHEGFSIDHGSMRVARGCEEESFQSCNG